MIKQDQLGLFNKIYDETYDAVLKHVVCNCKNIHDVNDVVQETYLELYKILGRREIDQTNLTGFVKGIANNKLKKHFTLLKRIMALSLDKGKDEEDDVTTLSDSIASDFNLEEMVESRTLCDEAWAYIKEKDTTIAKVFFLYYYHGLSLIEISKSLNKTQSYVKNVLYRTLKELNTHLKKGGL